MREWTPAAWESAYSAGLWQALVKQVAHDARTIMAILSLEFQVMSREYVTPYFALGCWGLARSAKGVLYPVLRRVAKREIDPDSRFEYR